MKTREYSDAFDEIISPGLLELQHIGEQVAGSSRASSEKSARWDDPDWSILDDRRGELPEFPIDTLSPSFRERVERAAHGAGVTAAHVAIPLIGIASSLIGTARRVPASRSFTQPMTCWAAILGFRARAKRQVLMRPSAPSGS